MSDEGLSVRNCIHCASPHVGLLCELIGISVLLRQNTLPPVHVAAGTVQISVEVFSFCSTRGRN
jgi:hypothetical protein